MPLICWQGDTRAQADTRDLTGLRCCRTVKGFQSSGNWAVTGCKPQGCIQAPVKSSTCPRITHALGELHWGQERVTSGRLRAKQVFSAQLRRGVWVPPTLRGLVNNSGFSLTPQESLRLRAKLDRPALKSLKPSYLQKETHILMHWNNTQAIQKMDKLMGHTYNLKNINESQTQ